MSLSFKVFDPETGAVYIGVGYNLIFHEVDVLVDGEQRQLDLSRVIILRETPIHLPDGRPLYDGDVVTVEHSAGVTHHIITPMTAVDLVYFENPFHHQVESFVVHGNEYVTPGLFDTIKGADTHEA